jgi:NADPH2:quinone reductase
VLIHAGAGGVGQLLTQIAKLKGARVITTVSTEQKAGLSRTAGADEVLVGYDDFAARVRDLTVGRGVEAVYDGVGEATFDGSLDALRVRGTMVLFGGASGQVPPFDIQRLNRGGSLKLTRPNVDHFVLERDELLGRADDIFRWIADGSLTVQIGGSYPLAAAAQAQQDLAGRRTTGKLLLLP